ncbi:tetratricopeptide repeat protein [Hyalangium sp. s54d21]|uniref:Tetratricopeptide repeat protein n=1 Tax=Hyalangium rubrum TaxID=3103134 RepID=A0ABU5H8R9_9BACT|nr:tetratricopeptide repeat protein [Hyalangium sp. s54d21]
MRNGKSDTEPGPSGAGQETLAANGLVERHLQVAARLLRERQAPKAFGELVRASRSLPMTRRLAAALVTVSLKAGTEAAAITILGSAMEKVEGKARRDVHRQLARVLRRVDQLPRALESLESLLAAFPDDHSSRRVYHALLERSGKWEALVSSLERESQEAFQRGEYGHAARATRWRARVQAEQLRNLARSAESYSKAATYLEQMEDAVGAFSVRLDGLRVLHASGASEAVLTAAASVVMSSAARLGRDAQAREVLEELGLIPARLELPPEQPAPAAEVAPAQPQRTGPLVARKGPAVGVATVPDLHPFGDEVTYIPLGARPTRVEVPIIPPEARPTSLQVPVVSPPPPPPPLVAPEARPTRVELPFATPDARPTSLELPAVVLDAPPAPPPSPVAEKSAPLSVASPVVIAPPALKASAPPGLSLAGADSSDERTTADAPPEASAVAPPRDDDEDFSAPEDVEMDSELDAAEAGPLTELLEIPDEAERSAPPVAFTEDEELPATRAEPAAPVAPPAEERDDPAALQRQEAQLIARKAWRELAQFYLARAERAKGPAARAEVLTQLAEVMEDELNDPAGAARMYGEIVALTGDRAALKEQVRLLSLRGNPSLVRRALDEAVQGARTPRARADAYLTRAELSLSAGERAQAKTDFETAEALTPGLLLVLAGLVRCVSDVERPTIALRLRGAIAVAPRRSPDRLEALRALASAADELLKDARLGQWAWTEVLAEDPADPEARERLLALARVIGDKATLSQSLREQLAREPRGLAARKARLELVSTLEAAGDADGALTELRQAVRFEPGHKEAWLLLADRLTTRGQIGEAAWALEHAATATEDEEERQRTWARLATFCREVLKDPARAEVYARRAENLRRALAEPSAPPIPEPPRTARPQREPSAPRTQVLIPPPGNVELTPSGQAFPPPDDEPATDTHAPVAVPPDDAARPTIEFSMANFPGGRMPFGEEEPTATEAPEGFVPPGEPAAPAPAPSKAAPAKDTRKKPSLPEPSLDASRELDDLLSDSGHTSPSLSIWNVRRKGDAPAPPPAPAPAPKAPVPPVRYEDTSPGIKAAANPPPPREATGARSAVTTSTASGARPAAPPAGAGGGGTAKRAAVQVPVAKRPTAPESPFEQVSPREPEGQQQPAYGNTPVQNTAFISWEAPPGRMEPVRRLARGRGDTTSARVPPPEQAGAEPAVFQQVREHPLDSRLYYQIANYFEERGDVARATLMREIGDALEGKETPASHLPRKPLSADDRSGLRHPLLRTPPGELLACVGMALCRLFPAYGRAAGSKEAFRPDLGVGAPATLDALETTQRLLGIQAPQVVLAEDNGPPFSLVHTETPRVLVGKGAVKQVLPAPELRFYAGRALICLGPDLLALRSLKKDQVLRGLAMISGVLKAGPASSPEALVVYETLQPKQIERAASLFDAATRQFDVSALSDAARDSANRAGLIACGAVGPALAALRLKRALEREIIELVRFAASERYFQLFAAR